MTLSQTILSIDKSITLLLHDIPIIYYLIGISFILPKIPFIGKFFNIINTLIHEFGHAVTSLLLQGKVQSIEIFGDTSGNTTTQSKGKFSMFLIAISGYLFSSSFAWFAFYLIERDLHRHFIMGLSILFLIMLIFWVRNRFGFFWIILFCILNGLIIYYLDIKWIEVIALFYATIILIESVVSTVVLLYLSIFKSKTAGDAHNLQKITHIPAFFWALGFVTYALFVAYHIFSSFIL